MIDRSILDTGVAASRITVIFILLFYSVCYKTKKTLSAKQNGRFQNVQVRLILTEVSSCKL